MNESQNNDKFAEIGGKTYKGGQNRVIMYPDHRPPPFDPPRPAESSNKKSYLE